MKHIYIESIYFDYPVGGNMSKVKAAIDIYAEAFLKIEYPKGSVFNLWCRGSSGAVLAAVFALHPSLSDYTFHICHVKKEGESAHSSPSSVMNNNAKNVIIDDFVSSGATIRAIIEYMNSVKVKAQVLIVSSWGTLIDYEFEYLITNS